MTLEEIINFTDKMNLLSSKIRQHLTTDSLFESNSYFNTIENILYLHKQKMNKLQQWNVNSKIK